MLPPLSLQVIVENALYQNKTCRDSPLRITIESAKQGVVIKNSVQRKMCTDTADQETGLDNLIKKYELMGKQAVEIHESADERAIILPLISKPGEEVHNAV